VLGVAIETNTLQMQEQVLVFSGVSVETFLQSEPDSHSVFISTRTAL